MSEYLDYLNDVKRKDYELVLDGYKYLVIRARKGISRATGAG